MTRVLTAAAQRRAEAREAAADHGGVLSRGALRDLGFDAHAVAREVGAERWKEHGLRTVSVHTGELGEAAVRWRAVWEAGRGAALDGVSALHAAGLVHFSASEVHVSLPHEVVLGREIEGVVVHRVRDHLRSDVVGSPPRVRLPVATVRAAQWAVSDRQSALLLCMAVQQRLVRAEDLVSVRWPGAHYGRTAFVRQVIADVADGAHSLGELDFAGMCRARGLPEPERQAVRTTSSGRVYLDARWPVLRLGVEIDGSQHRQGLAVSDDNYRRNELTLGDDRILTIDLVGLRLAEDAFMDQVVRAHAIQRRRLAA